MVGEAQLQEASQPAEQKKGRRRPRPHRHSEESKVEKDVQLKEKEDLPTTHRGSKRAREADSNTGDVPVVEETAQPSEQPEVKVRRAEVPAELITDYESLSLNPFITRSLKEEFKFTELTEVQARCIPLILRGLDILAEAKTGSGKTLAFLIPCVEVLSRAGFKSHSGTGTIVIGPTRELCQQTEGVLLKLTKFTNGAVTALCCIGGVNRKTEGYKLASGVMIVISTPGRLLDHLKLTTDWQTRNLLTLCIDEADRVLDNGFEEDLREIVHLLPVKRQTLLFSATQTTRVEQLARVSFRREPVFVSLKPKSSQATVDTLEQGYVVCPSAMRFLVLYHFLRKYRDKKIIVFFSSRTSVSFHSELLNYIDVPCVGFHGKQKQHQRSATYMQFCNAPSGTLLTTDVSSRGLDIPRVDWIVQYDPPDDPVKYIHRVGRTARAGRCGNALMFLLPSEKLFLKYLRQDAKISVNELEVNFAKLNQKLQGELEKLVSSNYYLRHSAQEAFQGYLLAYSSSQLKNVFNVQELDLAQVCRGFGLSEPPPISIDLSQSAARVNKRARKDFRNQQVAASRAKKQGGGYTQWTK